MRLIIHQAGINASPTQLSHILNNKFYGIYYNGHNLHEPSTLKLEVDIWYDPHTGPMMYNWFIELNESEYNQLTSLIPRKTVSHINNNWVTFMHAYNYY